MREPISKEDLEFINAEQTDTDDWDCLDTPIYPDQSYSNDLSPNQPNEAIKTTDREVGSTFEESYSFEDECSVSEEAHLDQSDLLTALEFEDADYDFQEDPSWERFALSENLPDENYRDDDTSSDQLSPEERALQIAIAIALEADWTRDEAFLIAEVLIFHGSHGKTRGALRELICEWGVSPEELRVLFELRMAWRSGGFNRTYWAATAYDGWENLSWLQALRLSSELRLDSAEAIMLFVTDCFEDWSSTPRIINAYTSFRAYLDAVLEHMDSFGRGAEHLMPPFLEYALFEGESQEISSGSLEWNELSHLGLLPGNGLGEEKNP